MSSSAVDQLLQNNLGVASSNYTPPPTFAQFGEALKNAGPDAARVCIVTCADPRCDADKVRGLA
jgi:carbonic anhydrase